MKYYFYSFLLLYTDANEIYAKNILFIKQIIYNSEKKFSKFEYERFENLKIKANKDHTYLVCERAEEILVNLGFDSKTQTIII